MLMMDGCFSFGFENCRLRNEVFFIISLGIKNFDYLWNVKKVFFVIVIMMNNEF